MRRPGLVDHVRGLSAHDHVCWRYGSRGEFRDRAREFLSEGLTRGYRVRYLSTGTEEGLTGELSGIEGLDEALRTGAAQVASLDAAYPVGAVVEPEAQVRTYAEETEAALDAGFTGLRVAADCTPLVGTPAQLEAFARYEHRIDHYMADQPISAMCAYAAEALDERAFAQVACMHPKTNTAFPGFQLHAAGDGVTALGGELYATDADLFAQALQRAATRPTGSHLVIDATELTFIDHNGLLRLERHAAERRTPVVLRTSWSGAARLVELLALTHIRVERTQ